MRRALMVLVLAATAACSGGANDKPSGSPSNSTTAERTSPAAAALVDAKAVVDALGRAGLPLRVSIVFNESNDPNNLLGRPNGYVSKTAFTDSRVKRQPGDELGSVDLGGSVEFFADKASAQRRKSYITGLQQNGGAMFGNEYEYINGAALLRVSGRLTPTQASAYESAFGVLRVKS